MASESLAEKLKNVLRASLYNRYGAFEVKTGTIILNDEMPYLICDIPHVGCKLAIISAPLPEDVLWFIDWADLTAQANPAAIIADHPGNHAILEHVGGFIA